MEATKQLRAPRILIVEDDIPLGKFLCRELGRRDIEVEIRTDGHLAWEYMQQGKLDLLILDLNLPGMDGMELLKRIRREKPNLAILVLTARSRTEDLERGLAEGADYFLIKPFSLRELIARIQRLLRGQAEETKAKTATVPDALLLNHAHSAVIRGEVRIELTPREFEILNYLVEHSGKIVTRKQLMEEVWRAPYDSSSNVVDVYMKYLRDKLDAGSGRKLIRTVRGMGYVIEVKENAA